MPPFIVLVSAIASLLVAGVLAATTRRARSSDPTVALTFETADARARHGWAAFWARDPFVQAHRARKGIAFGTYAVPGGAQIATHLAASDLRQHTLVLGATRPG